MYKFKNPKIPEYYAVVYSNGKIFFRSPERFVVVEGSSVKILAEAIKYLNGKFTIKEIKSRTKLPEINIKKILNLLAEKNLLCEGLSHYKKYAYLKETSRFFLRASNKTAQIDNLNRSSILFINANPLAYHMITALARFNLKIRLLDNQVVTKHDIEHAPNGIYTKNDLGISRINAIKTRLATKNITTETAPTNLQKQYIKGVSENHDLIVLCGEGMSTSLHTIVNDVCHKTNKPWLNVRLLGDVGEIGPLVIPFKTPCFTCYESRTKSNLKSYEAYKYNKLFTNVNEKWGTLKEFYVITANYAVMEIIKFFTNYATPYSLGGVISIDFRDNKIETDALLKVPNCSVCGLG